MSNKMEEIKKYWDQQAIMTRQAEEDNKLKVYDEEKNIFCCRAGGGTSKDLTLKDLETEAFVRQLQIFRPMSVLEVGCGMGIMTTEIAQRMISTNFFGVDYSPEMIANANQYVQQLGLPVASRLSFDVADTLSLTSKFQPGQFDVILTDRCLINLADWDLQKKAIIEIHAILPNGGAFLMIEGSQQGLANLNTVRQRFGLNPIESVWHNLFFDENQLIPFVEPFFHVKEVDSFCSTFMLISRVLHHKLKDQDPSFNAPINEMGSFLPNFGDYGYLKLFVFVKK